MPRKRRQQPPANAIHFMGANFPELLQYPRRTSRMYERTSEHPNYSNNWWFNLTTVNLDRTEFVILAGALDYTNEKFNIFKFQRRMFSCLSNREG